MNISKQIKNLGKISAIGAAVMMSSMAVNAATIRFAEGDQVIDPNVDPNFSLTLVAEDLLEFSYGGGLGITFDSSLVNITGVTLDPIWNLSTPSVVDNGAGTLELNVAWFSFPLVSPINTTSQDIATINFTAVANAGNFDFGFYSLAGLPWGYTPDLIPAGENDERYCMTMDSALPTTCMDIGFPDANGRELLTLVSSNVVVPVPAAVWLFGSGLIGLVAVSRRKAA